VDSESPSLGFLSLPVLKLRGAQLLMLVRLMMALAFHMFAPVWQVSIRARFDFGPRDHAQFMGLVGLTYALSQGFIAKPLVRSFGDKVSRLLLLCILVLGGARPLALYTQSVGVVYACYVPMVIALGVMNTAITTAASRLAQKEQLGGFYGVMESVENVAGMVGPALGGLLARVDGFPATITAVVCFYAVQDSPRLPESPRETSQRPASTRYHPPPRRVHTPFGGRVPYPTRHRRTHRPPSCSSHSSSQPT